MNLDVIYENENYLIINKPAGLIAHSGNGIKEKTLTDYLLEKYPEIAKVGEDPNRPGIVHRLDKEASGLMIIVKNNEAFEYFKNQFKSRKVEKKYTALVCGKLSKDQDVISFPIKRSSQGFKMAAIPNSKKEIDISQDSKTISNRYKGNIEALEKSRNAITEYKIIKRFINFTLVRVKIKTGRTHQIRVHFFAYGHPLLGDNLYKNKKSKIKNQKLKTERIFLIADKLGFKDINNEWKEFKISLSSDLKDILKKIK